MRIIKILIRNRKRLFFFMIFFILASFFLTVLMPYILYETKQNYYEGQIYSSVDKIPGEQVAIVFGAGIWDKETPTDVLRDRILTAVYLYKAGKVKKIIMSGDNSYLDYDEPSVMINYAAKNGVPRSAMQPDYAGRRTYDTCLRARDIFDVKEAILITQDFHLPRALYLCNSLGVESIGLSADLSKYPSINYMRFRDRYALALAIIDLKIRKPEVILGEKIELF